MIQNSRLDQGCVNLRWAMALIAGLEHGGMRHLVLSPGSRSTPLVLAAQRHAAITTTAILDERSAAFFALGLARASDRPVGVVCTSGSALSHWFPAVIEASQAGLPLVLISADRPPELRGWGANQTIEQTGMFGRFVREFHDPGPPVDEHGARKAVRALGIRAACVSQASNPGPVHINLPFREPLVPGEGCHPYDTRGEPCSSRIPATPMVSHDSSKVHSGYHLGKDILVDLVELCQGRGLICCGPMRLTDASAAAVWRCAEALAVPVLTDPLSDLRFRPASACRITRYDSFLRHLDVADALRPDWVLRLGAAPVSKTLQDWLAGVPSILVDLGGRWADPTHDVCMHVDLHPTLFCDLLADSALQERSTASAHQDFIRRWAIAEDSVDRLSASFLAQSPWFEGHLLEDLLSRLPSGDGLFCANSLPIRQFDQWSGQSERRLQLFGQRGASGIDGNCSTLAGLNKGRDSASSGVTGLLGDLAFIHDLGGLQLLEAIERPCIVLNNGGGRIFDYLPQSKLDDFQRLWRTPQRVSTGSLARAFGVRHRQVDDRQGFQEALDDALSVGRQGNPAGLIEVRVDALLSLQTHRAFWKWIGNQRIIDLE